MPQDNLGTLAYVNGIWVTQCFTTGIEQELIMDSTGIDHVATKVTIKFSGVVTKNHPSGTGRVNATDSGTAIYQTQDMGLILERLNKARAPFAYFIDSEPAFASWPVESFESRTPVYGLSTWRFGVSPAVDYNQWYPAISEGGKISASVIKVHGDQAARVSFTVEYTYVPCDGGSVASINRLNASPVMSLRWWVEDVIDGNTWLQTRTYNGEIRLSNRRINPHFARYVVMPPLTKGYKRQSIKYLESQDGTSLSFTIVDKELFIQAPAPATNFRGAWSLSQKIGFGANAQDIIPSATLNMSLSAPKNISKRYLAKKMMTIANTKVAFFDTPGALENADADFFARKRNTVITSIGFNEEMHENSVSCQMTVLYTGKNSNIFSLVDDTFGEREGVLSGNPENSDWTMENIYSNDALDWLPDDQRAGYDYDPDTSIYEIPPTSTLAGIALCAIQSPCSPNIAFNRQLVQIEPGEDGSNDNQQFEEGKSAGKDQESSTDQLKGSNHVVQEDISSPYLEYRITERYSEIADTVAGSFSYVDDSTQRRNSGFHNQGRGRAIKDVSFSATRANKRPKIPGPYNYVEQAANGEINVAVTDYQITNNSMLPSVSGQQIVYQTSGGFKGLMSRGYSKGEAIRVSTTPVVGEYSQEQGVDVSLFSSIPGDSLVSFDDPIFNKNAPTGGSGDTDPGTGDGGSGPEGAT